MAPAPKHQFWVFTLNNYEPDHEVFLRKYLALGWVLYGHEIAPTTGTPHLQGAFWTNEPMPLFNLIRAFKKNGMPGIRIFRCGPSKDLAYWQAYCTKEGCDIVQHGICPTKEQVDADIAPKQGERTDLEKFKDEVKSGEFNHAVLRENHSTVYARCRQFCLDYVNDHLPKPDKEEIEVLYDWQVQLLSELRGPADRRKIVFIVDELGSGGKSTFCSYLEQELPNVQVMIPEARKDMSVLVDVMTRIVLIDVPRFTDVDLPYSFMEQLKNARVSSTKYNPQGKRFPVRPHVVVFSNFAPCMTALSQDRYDIRRINKK